jgi:1-acyl-sn-glycerol-3-phosphate acyltransferase
VRTMLKGLSVLLLLSFYVLASFFLILLPAGRANRRRFLTRNTSFFASLSLRALGIRVQYRTQAHRATAEGACLIVANHVSYVDILVIAAQHPSIFITSIELRDTFPLGLLARCGGSIFVERRTPLRLRSEIRSIESVLRHGISVALFPEGTTFDGDSVHPFKSSFFTAAIRTGVPILPLCLRYNSIDGKRITAQNRDSLYYYGGMSFSGHAPRLLALRAVLADCIALDPVPTDEGLTRKDLSVRCYGAIAEAYRGRKARSETGNRKRQHSPQ